jgi:hypothetical protein
MDEAGQRSSTMLLVDASSSGATDGGVSGGPPHPESGGGRDNRRHTGVDGGDDLGIVDALQIDGGGDPKVDMTQLPLDDVERGALVREFDCVAWRSWWGANLELVTRLSLSAASNRCQAGVSGARTQAGVKERSWLERMSPSGSQRRLTSARRVQVSGGRISSSRAGRSVMLKKPPGAAHGCIAL